MGTRREYIEIHRPDGRVSYDLETTTRLTLGKAPTNNIVLDFDSMVSRTHAALEPYGETWCIRDLGSTNGTFVNGERVFVEKALRDKDELTIGATRLIFRGPMRDRLLATATPGRAPILTPREHDVLVALCRPAFRGDFFTAPATVEQIAQELSVSKDAVKQHLMHLYDKFEVHEGEGERRVRLANEALRRGAVNLDDLRKPPPRDDTPTDDDR